MSECCDSSHTRLCLARSCAFRSSACAGLSDGDVLSSLTLTCAFAVLKASPDDEDALRCKAALLIKSSKFDETLALIEDNKLASALAFEKVGDFAASAQLCDDCTFVIKHSLWLFEKLRTSLELRKNELFAGVLLRSRDCCADNQTCVDSFTHAQHIFGIGPCRKF